mmetsp:Transcript_46706/g.87716  ORF Transcript_46706/g.87716 Transcript_46706/m.87716 type:complete len:108 (+) Transcript_46706:867-1190(+)
MPAYLATVGAAQANAPSLPRVVLVAAATSATAGAAPPAPAAEAHSPKAGPVREIISRCAAPTVASSDCSGKDPKTFSEFLKMWTVPVDDEQQICAESREKRSPRILQ